MTNVLLLSDGFHLLKSMCHAKQTEKNTSTQLFWEKMSPDHDLTLINFPATHVLSDDSNLVIVMQWFCKINRL